MLSATMSRIKRFSKRAFRMVLCAMMVFQTLLVPTSALAAETAFYFRGYGSENINSTTLNYATSGASVSGRDVTISATASEGEAIGLVNLNETGHDISQSVDLGGLEIDFSVVSNVTEEGVGGADNDVPAATIYFCSSADLGSVISSVTLHKADNAVAGSETLSSGAKIPDGTRSIFLSLKGTNKTGNNTVTFTNTSLVIRDAGAPTISADYTKTWTNQDVTVTINAADSDAGLEGIYVNDTRVTGTSPYTFVVSSNNTSFTAYAMDLAGKKSDVVSATVDHIDKTTPAAPSSVPLSSSNWTNADVYVLMPALSASTGSPERYVYQLGSSAWATLPDGFAITAEGNSVVRVAVEDEAGNRSAYAQATAKIDKSAPTISNATITSGSSSAKVDVTATDVGLSGIAKFAYAEGTQTANYFTTGGTLISNGTFTVGVGGTYTLFASDIAGNTALKTISITTAPTFDAVSNVTMNEDETRNVPLSISDAESARSELTVRVSTTNDALLEHVVLNQSDSAISLDITPAANQSGGPVTVTVEVEDPSGQKVSRQFTVTVQAVNDLPVAQNDSGITVNEDNKVEIDVLANDSDLADGDTLSIKSVGDPAHGTTLIVLGKVRYTPAENYAGTDSFTYEVSDGKGGTAQATVSITVNQVNDAPTALANKAYTAEDTAVSIDALSNDTDVDFATDAGESISLVSSANGSHGTTEIVGGLVVYTPDADFNGTDTFTYMIEDKAGLTSEATVTVTVAPEADAPRFAKLNTEYTIDEDAKNAEIAFEIYDVETPADSLMLQAATLDSEMLDQTGIAIQGLGDSNVAVKLLLSPVANQHGDVNIKLTLGDGFDTVEQTIVVHITNVNDAPRSGADTRTFTEDSAYLDISIAGLLANDSDIDGDTVFFDGLAGAPGSGTIELLNATTLRYTPVADFSGKTSFTYYISDGTARTLATCTLEATGVNDAPTIVITETEIAGTEDTVVLIPFAIADQESAAADLEVIVASSDDNIVTTDGVTVVNNGDGTGEVQILPSADANGSPTITMTVSDGEAQASDSVKLIIAPTQDAPVAEDDLVYVHYTTSRSFSLLINDHDVDGDTLTVKSYAAELPGTLTFDIDTQMFTYVPSIGENGVSTFTYTITDGKDTDTATVELDVVSETHSPVITAIDSQYVSEDGTLSGIAFSVSDEDIGDTATITVDSGNTTILPEDASHITVSNNGSGSYSLSLSPAADQSGTVSVTVTVTDGSSLTDSTTFYLHVIGQNDAPVAVDDAISMNEDGSLTLNLLGNDSDPDGDTIWLSSLSWPSHGYMERTGNTYTYYPYDNWSGTETLTYRVSDGRATAQATAAITVNPVNDTPIARDDWHELANVTGTESTNINVLGNDDDADAGDVIRTYEIVTSPSYGTAVIETNGSITYTRNQISPLGNGADSFVYRIIDRETATGDYRSATATVHIGVEFTSTLYTYGTSVYCYEDDAAFNIDIPVTNPTPVTYGLTINTTTALGTFEVIDNNTVRFTPAPNQNGYASISYTVEQIGGGEKDTGTIWLRVYPVNDLPEITSAPSSVTFDEDATTGTTFDVAFRDADIANEYLYFYVYTQSGTSTSPIPFLVSYSVTRTEAGAKVTVHADQNVNGTGKIIIGVSDGMTYTEKTIDLTIRPVDDAPVVNPVTKTINEDSSVTFASPGSDSEADGDSVSYAIDPANMPQHGTATLHDNHTITYVPNANYYGTDTFKVLVTDETEAALSTAGQVSITVRPINDAPEIRDLSYYQTTLEDTAKDVTLTVSDVDNDMTGSARYTLTSEDQTLVKNANITISHVSGEQMVIHVVPEANAYGTVKINVVASDGSLNAKAAFSLKIVPVNDIPLAVDDTASVNEAVSTGAESTPPKTTVTLNLLTNDSDVEDGKPSVVAVSNVVNATVANIGGGKVLVTADGDFSGTVTFTYTVMDRAGATDTADVTLTVNAVNDPPRAKADSITILEDATPQISVLANDSDPEGDTLSISSVGTPAHGTAQINGTSIDYVPVKDYFGTDSFNYTVSDGNGGTATATVTVTIKPVNDAPTVNKHSSNAGDWQMLEDTTQSFNFVVADAESAVNNLIIKITSLDETLVKTTQIQLTTNAAGYKVLTVTPVLNAYGVVDLKISVSDGLLSTEAIYPLTIVSVNDAPVVTAPVQTTKEDTQLHASAYATDAEGDSVTFAKYTDPAHGTVTVSADGSYDYMPAKDYNGEDSFIILADDGKAENHAGYATVYITVKPDNDPPTAQDDSITIDEDTPTTVSVMANDTDQDVPYGDKISLLSVTAPAHGTAVISGDDVLYTPDENYNGTDSFTYTITDRDGKTDTATVSVTIRPVNDAPKGGDDTASVLEDHSVDINVTENDDVDETTNPDLEDVTILSVDTPAHGTASISTDKKTITYTPDANWFSPEGAPEVFYYTAKDSSDQTGRFAVTVTVTSVNDLPVITPDDLPNVTTAEDTETEAITFTVSDIETAAGSLTVTATHLNGVLLPAISVTPNADGTCSFTVLPNANKVGSAVITVKVTDADGGQTSDTFTLTVTPVNDNPRPGNDAFTVAETGTYTADVLTNDDVDTLSNNGGDTLTLLSIATPQYGTATIVNNKLYYVPKADRDTTANYYDIFTYTMKDASGATCTPTVTVTVTPVNDAPTISAIADVTGILEDAPDGTGEISFSVTDEEDDDNTLAISTASSDTTLFPVSNISITNPTDDPTGSLRTVKVIPAANQYGTGTITLTVRDAQGKTATSSFDITVESVNDVPYNGDKSFTVVEDVEKQLDVLTGIDPDYATVPADITITAIATQPEHGTARIASDGKSVFYKTAQDSNAPDSFQYTIHDAFGNADYTFTVDITVTPVNDAPVITYLGNATYTIYEGTQQNDIPFTVTDVDNVTDASGTAPVEVTLTAKSSNSILLVGGIHIDTLEGNNRDIDLKPYLKWNGNTTVTITATDPGGLKATASFQLVVNNVNDTPVAVNDSFSIPEDQTSSVSVLTNDTDDDLTTNPATEYIKVKTVTDNDPNAVITRAADGLSITVVPSANYNGPLSFTYTVEDALGAESNAATVGITVTQVNDAPVTAADTATTNEDTAVDISVLSNDSDIDMQSGLNANPSAESISAVITGTGLTAPSHGSIATDGTKITYTPAANYNGTDTFDYYCSDGDVKTKGTVTVTVKQVNDNPVANTDTVSTNEDTATVEVDVLANDTDVDTGAALNLDVKHLTTDFTITDATVTNASHGSVQIVNNKLKFTPALNWFGVEVVNYTMSDGHGGTSSSTLTVTVISVNDLPVFDTAPENMSLTEDGVNGVTTVVVSDIETAAASLAVTVTNSTKTSLIATTDVTVTAGAGGTRTITVNPKNDQNGSATITLQVKDGNNATKTITFVVTVAAVNDTPIANDKTLNISEDATLQTVSKSPLTSDVDIATNNDALTLTITTAAQHGTAGIDASGNVTYIPNANFNGVDTFVYTATDSASVPASDTGTFTVNISQVNDAPVTTADTATTNEDTAVDIMVLSNDSDIDMQSGLNANPAAESISAVITGAGLTAPAHGTIATDGTKITYTPAANYNGTDTFDYYCSDGDTQVKGTVTVTIYQVNDNPVAVADTSSTNEDTAKSGIDVLANDTDVDTGSTLNLNELHSKSDFTITAAALTNSAHGSVEIVGNKLNFTPALNWFGTEVVNYTVSDGHGGTANGTLTMTVNPINDLPLFDTEPEDMSLSEDGADGVTTVVVSDIETAAASLAVTVISSTNTSLIATSDVTVTAGTGGTRTITVNPKLNQNGTATITLKVDDLTGGTRTVTFDVTVAAVNDAPVAIDKTLNIDEDAALQTVSKTSLTSDVDIATNADALTLTISSPASHGTATIDASGNVTYIPTANFNGTDSFEYTATDKEEATDTGTFTISIAQVNDAPVTAADTATTNEDTAVDISVLSNDSDVDMDAALNAHPESESISVVLTGTGLTAPAHGTIATDGTKITYTPAANYNGTDVFDYYCSDGDVKTKGTVTVTIKQVDDSPAYEPDFATIDEDTATGFIDVMANDTDVDLDPALNQDNLLLRSNFYISAAWVSDAASGTVTRENNQVKFTPAANWFGTAKVYYTLQDGYGASCVGLLTITVNPINDLPVYDTEPEDMNLSEDGADGATTVVVSDIETAAASLAVTVTGSTNTSLIATSDVTVTAGTGGTRTITVNPKLNQNGMATITLQVDDLTGGKRTVTFDVTVASVNDAPVAIDKTLNIDEDAVLQTVTKASLTTDVDIATDADALTLTISSPASHGTAGIDANGNVTYIPTANFNGTDSFEYTATDKFGGVDTGIFTIHVAPLNDAPVTVNDSKTTNEDTAVDINVLTNDSDVDMDAALNAHPESENISVVLTGTGLTAPAHGTIATDGTKITYTPAANYNGTDVFDYYCSDGDVKTKGTVTVTIKQVNDIPVANPEEATISEDTATDFIDVLANDTDVDLDSFLNQDDMLLRSKFYISAASVNISAYGTVELVDNKIRFTPTANWNGVALVYYTLQDGYGMSCSTALRVTVTPVNDLPYSTLPPATQNLTEDGEDGASLFYVNDVETAASLVNVTLKSCSNTTLIPLSAITLEHKGGEGRLITVNPADNRFGDALITLVLEDADGGKTEVTMEVHVSSVNDAPVAQDRTLDLNEDIGKQTFFKFALTSDVDIATNADVLTLSITTPASHGTAAIDSYGDITYVPNKDFNGVDTFVYTVTDKAGAFDTGTFTINLPQVNDAPVAQNDAATTDEDTAVDVYVLDNDSDVDMDAAFNAHPEEASITAVITGAGLTASSHGTIATDGTKITYTPNANYNGTDTFDYYCFDGHVQVKATVTVTIKQVNDNPVANADSTSTDEDTAVSYNVLANDSDVDTVSALNEDALHLKSSFTIDSCYFYGGTNGTHAIDGANIVYTPASDFYGTQIIKYVLKDGNGGTSTGTLTVLVGSKNDAPVAYADEMSADEDHVASVNVLTNDTDVDTGDTKTFLGFIESTSGLSGTFTTDENGELTFTPDANYNGSFELTYQMQDAAGLISSAKLTVTINPINDAPVADDQNVSAVEDTQKTIDVSGIIGDVDVETNDDVITVSVTGPGEPAHGTVSVSGTEITYTPEADYNGTDMITYTVTDAKGLNDIGRLNITVSAINDAPVAVDDEKTVLEDSTNSIFALVNDYDVDTDDMLNAEPAAAPYILSVTDGAYGTATTDGTKITYTPDADYNGADAITYVLSDGLKTAEATIELVITQVNDGIVAKDDLAATNDEETVTVDALGNDTDVDTDKALNEDELHLVSSFRITAVGTPEHGTAQIVSGKIEYTPEDRFAGDDTFTYTASDGHGTTSVANVTVTVISVNDPPVIKVVSSPKDGDRAGTGSKITVEWTGFDIDGDALTYTLEYYDGKTWQLIDKNLTGTKYEFAIPDTLGSTDGLKFRVNVRDSEFTSEYGYSGAMKVDKDAPKGTVVTMQTADGKTYTAGTWTNQTVTVVASSAVDASKVTYYYDMDGGASAAAAGMDVTQGVHTVNIRAVDEYGNSTVVGAYLARVDKQQPAVPEIRESVSGGAVVLTLTLSADPGGSGNNTLILPDGTTAKASGSPTFSVTKNGTVNFTLTDIAGNRRAFTHTVGTVDVSKPVITLASGAFRTGTITQDTISAMLTFSDAESDIVNRGYQLSQSATPSGSYRTYDGALKITDAGTYYIHAYAKNAFGLATYETFGPFIIEAVAAPAASPTPAPETGDVVVTKEDVEEIPGDTVKIRLPGKEWSETLTLEDVGPGTYLIEAMDADGNVRTVEVRVTMRDIFARSIRSAGDNVTQAAVLAIAALAAIAFALLFSGYNITVVVVGKRGASEQKLRTLRRIKFRKKELLVKLENKHLDGGEFADFKVAKALSKKMRGNTIIVTFRGEEVLRETLPEDFDESFRRKIMIER